MPNFGGAVGTIVMDPLFQVGLGKSEGRTIPQHPIPLNDGAWIAFVRLSDISLPYRIVLHGCRPVSLTLAGKIVDRTLFKV